MELVIRFGFGANIPWVKRTDGGALLAICGPDMTVLRTPVETHGEDMTTVAEFEVAEGDTRAIRADLRGLRISRCPMPIDPGAGAARHRRILGGMVAAAAPIRASIATW